MKGAERLSLTTSLLGGSCHSVFHCCVTTEQTLARTIFLREHPNHVIMGHFKTLSPERHLSPFHQSPFHQHTLLANSSHTQAVQLKAESPEAHAAVRSPMQQLAQNPLSRDCALGLESAAQTSHIRKLKAGLLVRLSALHSTTAVFSGASPSCRNQPGGSIFERPAARDGGGCFRT